MRDLDSQFTDARLEAEQSPEMIDREKADKFLESKLNGENRIEVPQHPDCLVSIVVPVYNESPARIYKQIESLRSQAQIDPDSFEVIYVVNNGVLDDSQKSVEIRTANSAVIEMLRDLPDINIFVVDKSSSGNEIVDCNVGKARNRGLAEASSRFMENGKNGIIVQIDADTYLDDELYLKKVIESAGDADVVGIAGGLVYEFDPDTTDPEEVSVLKEKLKRLILMKKWNKLVKTINGKEKSPVDEAFHGANMISKSFETAVIGGVKELKSGEDPQFGLDLKSYAFSRDKKVIAKKNDIKVVTAMRESDRTTASYKKDFDKIDLSSKFIVADPFDPATRFELTDEAFDRIAARAIEQNPEIAGLVGYMKSVEDSVRFVD